MGKRRVFDFNGIAIDLNNVNYVEKTSEGSLLKPSYGLKFTFWSGSFKIIVYYSFQQRNIDYDFAVQKLNE